MVFKLKTKLKFLDFKMFKIIIYIAAICSVSLAGPMKVVQFEDLGHNLYNAEYLDYDDIEFLSDDDDYNLMTDDTMSEIESRAPEVISNDDE
uniref:Uncharacterized protein n=1 Tax=Megaselia scalaris TaxID=36166 RepID=T1H4C8_MEGSC